MQLGCSSAELLSLFLVVPKHHCSRTKIVRRGARHFWELFGIQYLRPVNAKAFPTSDFLLSPFASILCA